MTDTYLVRVGGKVFEFSETSLQTDAPNIFTEMFWGGKVYGVKEIFFDRDPIIFEVISRYLRGYEIFPISSINLPVGMSENMFRHNLLRDAKFFQLTKLSESMITMDTRIGDVFNSHFKIEKRLVDIEPLVHLQLKRFGEKQFVVYKSDGMPVVLFHMGGVICDVAPPSSTIEWRFQPVDLDHSRIIRDIIVNIIGESYNQKKDIFNGSKSISAFEIDGQKVYGSEIYSKFKDKTAEVDKHGRIRFLLSKLIFSLEVMTEHQQNNSSSSTGGKIKHRIKPVWGTGITEPTWLAHRGT